MAINDIWHSFSFAGHVQLNTDWHFDCALAKMAYANADSLIQIQKSFIW